MIGTTIPVSGLPENRHTGGVSRPWPGDSLCAETWVIERNRPYDPLDPGPYGSFKWYPDERTGRHRRGELPDPPVDVEEAPTRRLLPNSDPEVRQPRRPSPGTEAMRPSPGSGARRPSPAVETEPDSEEPTVRRRPWDEVDTDRTYSFGRLREEAWTSFIEDSAVLHRAHYDKPVGFGERFMRFLRTLFSFVLHLDGPPRRPAKRPDKEAAKPVAPQPRLPADGALDETPRQGPQRTTQVSPFVLEWERHFDAACGFREAVAL